MELNSTAERGRDAYVFIPALLASCVGFLALTGTVLRVFGPHDLSGSTPLHMSCSVALGLVSAALILLASRREGGFVGSAPRFIGYALTAWAAASIVGATSSQPAFLSLPLLSAIVFLLLGLAVVTIRSSRSAVFYCSHAAALLVGAIGLEALVSRVFQVSAAVAWVGASVPVEAAAGFIFAAASLIALRPDRGVGLLVFGDGLARIVTAPLIVAALLLPVLFDVAADLGSEAGIYDLAVKRTIETFLISVSTGAIVILAGIRLDRVDRRGRDALVSLVASEERYRDLVDHSNDLVCTHDLHGRLLSVNPAVVRALGIPSEQLVGGRIQDLLAPGQPAAFAEYLETIEAKGEVCGQMRVKDASGRRRTWEYRNTLRYRDGRPSLVRGMARDITEQTLAERALRKSESRYRMLFENAPQPMIVVDESGWQIIAANGTAVSAFGYAEEELLNKRVLGPDFIVDLPRAIEATTDASPIRSRSSMRMRRMNGQEFLADVSSSAIEYEGRAARLVVILDVTEREDAKRRLIELQQFDEEVISGAGQGIIVTDRELRIVVWNQFMEQLTGVPTATAIGQPVSFFPFFRNGAGETRMREVLQSSRLMTDEIELKTGSETRHLLAVDVPHRNSRGDIIGVIAIVSDITDQKQTQEALRRSEELFRSVIDSTSNFIFSYDRDGRYMTANQALCSALGLSEKDILGKTDLEVGLPVNRAREWDELRRQVISTGDRIALSTSMRMDGGDPHVFEVIVGPLCSPSGEVTGVSGVAVDVTDRHRATASLNRLSQAVDQASDVIFMTDRGGIITYANPAFESVYGFALTEVLGQTPRLLKSGMHSEAVYTDFWRRIQRGETVRGELVNKRKDGSFVVVDRSVTPVYDARRQIVGFISVQTDVSERRKMLDEQEKLRARMIELDKMQALGTLAGGIAHDFNNILAIVLSFATVAEKRRHDPERFLLAMDTIRRAVRRGADLAKQVLTFARRTERMLTPIDLNDVVREIATMARQTFPKTIHLETDLDDSLPRLLGDASELHQALLNLAVNARDAMPGGGTLRVTTTSVSGSYVRSRFPEALDVKHLRLEVTDTGMGMPDEVRQRIFEPFFTTKADGRGTGIGLALTYGVVRAAGGFIGVESVQGRGSRFELLLPFAVVPSAAEDTPGTVAPGAGKETVLVVEDEPDIGPYLVEALQSYGYAVLFARDGAEALELFERNADRIDIVVSDDGLPFMRGCDLFLEIRRRKATIPFVLASGFVEPAALDELSRRPPTHFLQKPYAVSELISAMQSTLGAR